MRYCVCVTVELVYSVYLPVKQWVYTLQFINQQHIKGAQSWDIRRRLFKPVREDDFVIFFKGMLSMFFEN
jgi:hypothetical protein